MMRKMREIIEGEDSREDEIDAFRALPAQIAQPNADGEEDEEKLPKERAEARGSRFGAVQPWQKKENEDGAEHGDDAAQF